MCIVFRKVKSFIYQKFYASDWVPLRNGKKGNGIYHKGGEGQDPIPFFYCNFLNLWVVAQYVRAAGSATRVAGSNPLELESALLSKI